MDWIMRSSRGILGGQPSMTTPTPFPWDSPHVVIFNTVPNVFPGIFASPFIVTLKTLSFGPPARRAYASESQVKYRWLCLGVLCLKSQIPSTKYQINPPKAGKSQISSIKFQTPCKRQASISNLKLQIPNRFKAIIFLFGILNFGH